MKTKSTRLDQTSHQYVNIYAQELSTCTAQGVLGKGGLGEGGLGEGGLGEVGLGEVGVVEGGLGVVGGGGGEGNTSLTCGSIVRDYTRNRFDKERLGEGTPLCHRLRCSNLSDQVRMVIERRVSPLLLASLTLPQRVLNSERK